MSLPRPALLLVTDRGQARRPLAEIVDAACAAGCRWVSVREKDLPPVEQLALCTALLPVARRHGARLTLHGGPALAREAGVDGVHLAGGSDVAAARALLGPEALIGLSIHHAGEMPAATGADYVVAGPAFESASKPGYGPVLGRAGIARLSAIAPCPLIAIGGVDVGNIAGLCGSGAAGAAVMGGVMRAADPGLEVAGLLAAMQKAHEARGQHA